MSLDFLNNLCLSADKLSICLKAYHQGLESQEMSVNPYEKNHQLHLSWEEGYRETWRLSPYQKSPDPLDEYFKMGEWRGENTPDEFDNPYDRPIDYAHNQYRAGWYHGRFKRV